MADHISITTPAQGSPSRISWGSVIAGAVIAIALMFCLNEMVMALGISFLKPQDPGKDASIPTIALAGAVAWVVTALVSVFAGGWAAAHLARQANETDSVLHGLLVWALGIATMLIIATSAAGVVIGGAFSLVSSGISAAGSAAGGVAHGTGAALGNLGKPSGVTPGLPAFNWDSIKFQAQNLMKETSPAGRQQDGAQNSATANGGAHSGAPAGAPAASTQENAGAPARGSEGLALLGRLFGTPGAKLTDDDRATAVSMLTASTSMSKDAATKQIQDWEQAAAEASQKYEALKAEAEQKARTAAAATAKALADAAWVAFAATLLGATAAMLGAYIGGTRTSRPPIFDRQPVPASA